MAETESTAKKITKQATTKLFAALNRADEIGGEVRDFLRRALARCEQGTVRTAPHTSWDSWEGDKEGTSANHLPELAAPGLALTQVRRWSLARSEGLEPPTF